MPNVSSSSLELRQYQATATYTHQVSSTIERIRKDQKALSAWDPLAPSPPHVEQSLPLVYTFDGQERIVAGYVNHPRSDI